jgi:ABC-2 type transport system ATP-binding protein
MSLLDLLVSARKGTLTVAVTIALLIGLIIQTDDAIAASSPVAGAISGGGPALTQLRYDLTIMSFDGTPIAVTLFQPNLAEGQAAPLLMYSHGWGGSRSTDLNESDSLTATARRAWESGYFVMTFDQRGFGESGGQANVQDPAIEGRDIQTLLNWAEGTLTPHLAYLRGDALVGGIGLSYGGGFQLVGAGVDPRFDALVPMITWHDLSYSLTPGGVPKTLWLTLLSGLALQDQAPWVTQAYAQSLSGNVDEQARQRLAGHGFGAFCGPHTHGGVTPRVDAFFIQGINDTLFNTNEAAWNYQCLREAGNDAYLLVSSGGHVLPGVQAGTLGSVDADVQCEGQRYRITDLAYNFLDGKLRKLLRRIDMPRVCLTQGENQGIVRSEVPRGGLVLTTESGDMLVGPPSIDLVLNLLRKLQPATVSDVLSRLSASTVKTLLGALSGLDKGDPDQVSAILTELVAALPPQLIAELGSAPRFVPLYRANGEQTLAGLPLAELTLEGEAAADPRVFVGLGVKRMANGRTELLHDQILPLRGVGTHRTELIGVSTQLRHGDEVGLMLYGFHPQYTLSFSKVPSAVNLRGTVQLPLQ